MSRINKTGDSIKKKLENSEEESGKPAYHNITPESHNEIKTEERSLESKKRHTYYITYKAEMMLEEIYIRRMQMKNKEDKSGLIEKAIELLYKEEKKYEM